MTVFNLTFNIPATIAACQPNRNQSWAFLAANVGKMHEPSMPAGTDSIGVIPRFDLPFEITLHHELVHFAEDAGFSPAAVLRAVTLLPAISMMSRIAV
jgi:hypothetical protein